jgi:hypothetical protein
MGSALLTSTGTTAFPMVTLPVTGTGLDAVFTTVTVGFDCAWLSDGAIMNVATTQNISKHFVCMKLFLPSLF